MTEAGSYSNLELVVDTGVATLTVTRPEALNALNDETFDELADAFGRMIEDDAVKAIVVTGAGGKAFVAGADITELAPLGPVEAKGVSAKGQRIFRKIESCGKPVIAAINGFALGGGLELALACHVRFAAENARLGLPEVTLALIPGYGGTQRLARIVGVGRALEMILSGDMVDAAGAERSGLVNRVCPPDELLATATAFARKVMKRGPLAVRFALEAVLTGAGLPLEDGLRKERDLFALCFSTEDMREGTTAFVEKRKPAFKGV
jgi:enoyl-CoA hydratase